MPISNRPSFYGGFLFKGFDFRNVCYVRDRMVWNLNDYGPNFLYCLLQGSTVESPL